MLYVLFLSFAGLVAFLLVLRLSRYFLQRFYNRLEEKKDRKLKERARYSDACYRDREEFIDRVLDMDWSELLKLSEKHGVPFKTEDAQIRQDDIHRCVAMKQWREVPGKICWLHVQKQEIDRRIRLLVRDEDLSSLVNLATTHNLDQAWEALGSTEAGVSWLNNFGLSSTNHITRARAYSTLYRGMEE